MENIEEIKDLPIIIFANYWVAKAIIDKNKNGKMYSISLSNPKGFENIEKVKCFCPTWDILKEYKENKDWTRYTSSFIEKIKKDKNDIKKWIINLVSGEYYLCCWENTKNGANCHRKILFDLLSESATMKKKAIYKYLD